MAPAKTGSGNSLTGDTRYSVETESDGSYRVVMPAGNGFDYNLIAHDGTYSQWRNWANAVSEPLKTKPNGRVEDFDFTLNRPATVRGRVIADDGRAVGKRDVRAHAADLRGNRYYDPTVRVDEDGSFELKFIRPGKHYIQVDPFWTPSADAPNPRMQILDLKEGEVREGIELRVAPSAEPAMPASAMRSFRVKVLDPSGRPVTNQPVAVSSMASWANLTYLAGDRVGLADRFEHASPDSRFFAKDAKSVFEISGKQIFNDRFFTATAIAIDPVNATGAIGTLDAGMTTPEITLRMEPLCEVSVAISTEGLPDLNQKPRISVNTGQTPLLSMTLTDERVVLQLPAGTYTLVAGSVSAQSHFVDIVIRDDQTRLELDPIRLEPSHLAKLVGKRAPELRDIVAWHNGTPLKLSELRGKVVILDFWGYWCGPCLAAMPDLMKIHDAYPEDEVVIIAVHDGTVRSVDQLLAHTEPARKQHWNGRHLPFRVAISGGGPTQIEGTQIPANSRAIADYGITTFPTTLLIDKDGKLVTRLNHSDPDSSIEQINRLLEK